jgi:hypothetical protein
VRRRSRREIFVTRRIPRMKIKEGDFCNKKDSKDEDQLIFRGDDL